MRTDDLVAGASLDEGLLPVVIVERDLHGLDLGVLREDPVERGCVVVIGEGNVTNLALLIPGPHVIEEVRVGDLVRIEPAIEVV